MYSDKPMYITLWLFNIAMENGPFIDGLPGLPIKNVDFPWLLITRWYFIFIIIFIVYHIWMNYNDLTVTSLE